MTQFELDRLTDYSEEMLLKEIRRVASLLPEGKIKLADFDHLSKVHSSTLRHRFNGWYEALKKAGLGDRFNDISQAYSREDIIETLLSVAKQLGRNNVTQSELSKIGGITGKPIKRIFGSYRAALTAAGFSQNKGGIRYTDEECFENLLNVWTMLGRQPFYSDMRKPPSLVGPKAYVTRWGSWRKARAAFVERANNGTIENTPAQIFGKDILPSSSKATSRDIPLSLRYKVLKRDRFRCSCCGRSPSTHPEIVLHVDHIIAWANGGETMPENLRALCNECNLGKGVQSEDH